MSNSKEPVEKVEAWDDSRRVRSLANDFTEIQDCITRMGLHSWLSDQVRERQARGDLPVYFVFATGPAFMKGRVGYLRDVVKDRATVRGNVYAANFAVQLPHEFRGSFREKEGRIVGSCFSVRKMAAVCPGLFATVVSPGSVGGQHHLDDGWYWLTYQFIFVNEAQATRALQLGFDFIYRVVGTVLLRSKNEKEKEKAREMEMEFKIVRVPDDRVHPRLTGINIGG